MLILRPNLWMPYPPEITTGILAQAETVFQRGMDAADKFGNANDSVRFGMVLVALLVGLGFLAWLYLSNVRATIKEQKERIISLEQEIRDLHESDEEKRGELHDNYERKLAGYWGVFDIALRELATNNRWLQGQNYVPRQHETPAVQLPPPAAPPESPRRAAFMPPGQSRRVPRIPPRSSTEES